MKGILLILLSLSAMASGVAKKESGECTNYRVLHEQAPIQKSESVMSNKRSYGFRLTDMEIDFETQTASFELLNALVGRFDRSLTGKRVFISRENQNFKEFTNLLYKDLAFMQEVCITNEGEVLDYKLVE